MEERNKEFKVKAVENEEFMFEGYLSTFDNEDRHGDVIAPGAFSESIKEEATVPMLFNHDRNTVIGYMELSEDPKGLKAKGYLNSEIQKAKEIYSLLKQGALKKMSIGMRVKEYSVLDNYAWKITNADVLEGSVVTIPANAQATISSVKSENSSLNTLDDIKKQLLIRIEKIKNQF